MSAPKKKFYAVVEGRKPGIYTRWFGEGGALAQVDHFSGAVFKGFATLKEAERFMAQAPSRIRARKPRQPKPSPPSGRPPKPPKAAAAPVTIYTDGGALNNPGPGGYGVVLLENDERREMSGGYRLTTNNRMELTACIVGLQSLQEPSDITLYSDSRYVVDGITKGWARRWRQKGWQKSNGTPALNPDLWEKLLDACSRHRVRFVWVKGHAGNPENERCDRLANQMAVRPNLPPDTPYEHSRRQERLATDDN